MGLDDEVKKVTEFDLTQKKLTTQEFYSECVRLNKPCKLTGQANEWPAVKKWGAKEGGAEELKKIFAKDLISVYTSTSKDKTGVASRTHSF